MKVDFFREIGLICTTEKPSWKLFSLKGDRGNLKVYKSVRSDVRSTGCTLWESFARLVSPETEIQWYNYLYHWRRVRYTTTVRDYELRFVLLGQLDLGQAPWDALSTKATIKMQINQRASVKRHQANACRPRRSICTRRSSKCRHQPHHGPSIFRQGTRLKDQRPQSMTDQPCQQQPHLHSKSR